METYQSRDDVREGYRRLYELEQINRDLLADDPDLDSVEQNLSTQSDVISAIEKWEAEHPDEARDLRSQLKQTIQSFAELRSSNRERVRDLADRMNDRMESLDQSMKVMRHYMQGRRRSEERPSMRVDREV